MDSKFLDMKSNIKQTYYIIKMHVDINAWLTSLTLQQLSNYSIMHEHVNACS